jgi:hypothetical protein
VTPLDFESVREEGSDSWVRARSALLDDSALIERRAWNEWLVTLPGGSAHLVTLERDHGAVCGRCDCRGFEFSPDARPCAHLVTVRMAAAVGVSDTRGRRIEILDADQQRADQAVEEQRARADGGSIGGRR